MMEQIGVSGKKWMDGEESFCDGKEFLSYRVG